MTCFKCERQLEYDEPIYQKVIQESCAPDPESDKTEPDNWCEYEKGWVCWECSMGEM